MKAKVVITHDDGMVQKFEAYVKNMNIRQDLPDLTEMFEIGNPKPFLSYGPTKPTEIDLCMTTEKPVAVSVPDTKKVQEELRKLGPRKVVID